MCFKSARMTIKVVLFVGCILSIANVAVPQSAIATDSPPLKAGDEVFHRTFCCAPGSSHCGGCTSYGPAQQP